MKVRKVEQLRNDAKEIVAESEDGFLTLYRCDSIQRSDARELGKALIRWANTGSFQEQQAPGE